MKTYGKRIDATPGSPPPGMYVPIEFPSLTVLNTRTRDGRQIMSDGFGVLDLPRTIKVQNAQQPGHEGSMAVGRLDEVTVGDDGNVSGTGWIIDSPLGRTSAAQVKTEVLRGNSVDLSVAQKDVAIRFIEDKGAFWSEVDLTNAQIAATTLCMTPAFDNAGAFIPEEWEVEGVDAVAEAEAIVAAASYADEHAFCFSITDTLPRLDPALFADPELSAPTPLVVDADDRVYGHVAAWGTPHMNTSGFQVTPPRSRTNYAYFANGHVLAGDDMIPTGRLVIDGNHADLKATWRQAMDHYANTCAAWADVACGEDEHGIWLAGIVRPGTPAEVVHAARASVLSGDWRSIGGSLEMVASLSVNAGGFPIARTEDTHGRGFALADGFQMSLLGAGMLSRPDGFTALHAQPIKVPASIEYLATRFATEEAQAIAAEMETM